MFIIAQRAHTTRRHGVSTTQRILDRDGDTCRLCGESARYGDQAPLLVNVRPGAAAGDEPELGIVRACHDCARHVSEVTAPPPGSVLFQIPASARGRTYRLLAALYQENLEMEDAR